MAEDEDGGWEEAAAAEAVEAHVARLLPETKPLYRPAAKATDARRASASLGAQLQGRDRKGRSASRVSFAAALESVGSPARTAVNTFHVRDM